MSMQNTTPLPPYLEASKLYSQLLEGKSIQRKIDLLKSVILSRTPSFTFFYSTSTRYKKTKPHHILESPKQLKKDRVRITQPAEKRASFYVFMSSASWWVFCKIIFPEYWNQNVGSETTVLQRGFFKEFPTEKLITCLSPCAPRD